MPAELNHHMNSLAWTKFCDKVDEVAQAGAAYARTLMQMSCALMGVASLASLGLVAHWIMGDQEMPIFYIGIPMLISFFVLIFIMIGAGAKKVEIRQQLEEGM